MKIFGKNKKDSKLPLLILGIPAVLSVLMSIYGMRRYEQEYILPAREVLRNAGYGREAEAAEYIPVQIRKNGKSIGSANLLYIGGRFYKLENEKLHEVEGVEFDVVCGYNFHSPCVKKYYMEER